MTKETNSICPIFIRYNDKDKLEQIGSGVLLKLKDKVFLLTAAHVTDWMSEGKLCIPTKEGIQVISGYVASLLVPKGSTRNKDKIDLAYFLLDDCISNNMSSDFMVLHRDDCWLTDNLIEGDIYTFTGFPLSKAKSKNNEFSSEIFSYTGEAAIQKKYENLGYENDTNIIINFRRKKAIDPSSGNKVMPPHPKGVSGGGIFRWPKNIDRHIDILERLLVGVCHTYKENQHALIGTKLSLYFNLIAQNHPELFEQYDIENNGIPMFIALVYYKKEEWPLLLSQFDDADNMQRSWSEWRNAAESGIEYMDRKRKILIPIELSSDEINAFCKKNNLKNIGRTRADLATHKLMQMIRESGVVQI